MGKALPGPTVIFCIGQQLGKSYALRAFWAVQYQSVGLGAHHQLSRLLNSTGEIDGDSALSTAACKQENQCNVSSSVEYMESYPLARTRRQPNCVQRPLPSPSAFHPKRHITHWPFSNDEGMEPGDVTRSRINKITVYHHYNQTSWCPRIKKASFSLFDKSLFEPLLKAVPASCWMHIEYTLNRNNIFWQQTRLCPEL